MKEYLKNSNEFILDGKRYVEKIRKCVCIEIEDSVYILKCGIHQRGEHFYRYTKGSGIISKRYNDKKALHLSDEALNTVMTAIAEHDKCIAEMKKSKPVTVENEGRAVAIRYFRVGDGSIAFFLEYDINEKHGEKIYYSLSSLHYLLFYVADLIYRGIYDGIVSSTKKTIADNPVYKAAIDQGDELFAKILKLHFGIADDSECSFLSEYFGIRILPSLPEEYNKDYYIDADTIDWALLYQSGYSFQHRPYFAMKGSTHEKITVNPHFKRGTDAAKISAESISFQKFLELFDENT